jgi:hypothetical protein
LPSEHPARCFADIIDNIERIEQFTAGMDFAAFVAQGPLVYAVQYALLIISEAARRLGPNAQALAPASPGRTSGASGIYCATNTTRSIPRSSGLLCDVTWVR